MTMIVYDASSGTVITDSFTSVSYNDGDVSYEVAPKTWTSEDGSLFFTVLGHQPWVFSKEEVEKKTIFEHSMECLKKMLYLIAEGNLKYFEEIRELFINGGMGGGDNPNEVASATDYSLVTFLRHNSFIAMSKDVVITNSMFVGQGLRTVTDVDCFIGVDKQIYNFLRGGGLSAVDALTSAVYVSDSACFPLNETKRSSLTKIQYSEEQKV